MTPEQLNAFFGHVGAPSAHSNWWFIRYLWLWSVTPHDAQKSLFSTDIYWCSTQHYMAFDARTAEIYAQVDYVLCRVRRNEPAPVSLKGCIAQASDPWL